MTHDELILSLISGGRLRVDAGCGMVYAPKSNTPNKPCGAVTKKGYLRVCINIAGKQKHFMIHRIVWVSVKGPVPAEHEIDHENTIKSDNRIENLEAVTGIENMQRGAKNGCFRNVGRRDGIRDEKGRFSKKAAGHLLDGQEWNELPEGRKGGT
jgi:hypothetical protein